MDNIIGLVLLVAAGWFITQRGLVEAFFDHIDLGNNLRIARRWVKRQEGWPAAVLGVSFAALSYSCGWLAYRFDILPTWEYARWVAAFVVDDAPDQENLAFIGFLITMMPTLIELTAVGLGKDGIKMVEYLVYLFAGIDVVTDWPDASRLVDGWISRGIFKGWPGWLHFVGEWAGKGLWTLMASFGFEMLTVVFGASALMLFLAAIPDKRSAGGGGQRAGI